MVKKWTLFYGINTYCTVLCIFNDETSPLFSESLSLKMIQGEQVEKELSVES